MCRMNPVPNVDVCRAINPKANRTKISSPLQTLQYQVNIPLIHMIGPAMMKEYLMPNVVAETTPGQSCRTARSLTAARLNLDSQPESPNIWAQVNPNLNEYHSGAMEIVSTFWIPEITDWWRQQRKRTQSSPISQLWHEIFSLSYHMVSEWRPIFPLWEMWLGGGSQRPYGETLREQVFVIHFARANDGIFAGNDPALDKMHTDNISKMKREAEERILHRMNKVHNFLEMWQGSQILRAAQKESRAQNKQMTTEGYTSDTQEFVQLSCSLVQQDGATAFKLSERLPLPPALSAKDLPGWWTQILNARQVRRINRYAVESDEDSAHDRISDTENLLNWNGDLDNPNDSKDHCVVVFKSHIQQDNDFDVSESPGQQDVRNTLNGSRLIRPTRTSEPQAGKVLVTVNTKEVRRNKGIKKEYDRMHQYGSAAHLCSLTENFIWRYNMGEWCAVACEYRLIKRSIVGALIH